MLQSPIRCVLLATCALCVSSLPTTKALVADTDADKDGVPDAVEHQLLERFRPYLRFTKDHGSDEHYNPTDVMFYLSCAEIIESGDENSTTILANSALTANPQSVLSLKWHSFGLSDITQNKRPTNYHINPMEHPAGKPAGNVGRHGNSWPDIEARRNVGLYGHVVPYRASTSQGGFRNYGVDPNHTYYKIEYWQFFGYNNAAADLDLGDHEGDWTSVQLLVDPSDDYRIVSVFHYAHGLEFRFDMKAATSTSIIEGGHVKEFRGEFRKDVDLVTHDLQFNTKKGELAKAQNNVLRMYRDGDPTGPGAPDAEFSHPVVYLEYGTHEFFPSEYWDYYAAPKHTGDSPHFYLTATPPNLGEVEHPLGETPAAPIILRYSGYWGAYSRRNTPPRGPALHDQWTWPSDSAVRWLLTPKLGF